NFKKTYEGFGADFSEKFRAAPDAFKDLQRKAEEAGASFNIQAVTLAPDKIQAFFDTLQQEAANRVIKVPVMADVARVTGLSAATHSPYELIDEFQKKLSA